MFMRLLLRMVCSLTKFLALAIFSALPWYQFTRNPRPIFNWLIIQMTVKRFDSWLILIFISRVALYANFMVYAACLPILLNKWDMSATQAGSISSAFMFV